MSLTDIDKSSNTRNNPSLNTGDQVGIRMSHGTSTAITLVDEQTSVTARVKLVDGHIEVYKNDGSLLFRGGLRPSDSDGAVDMAKPGQAL